MPQPTPRGTFETLTDLLRPHTRMLTLGLLAAIGETIADVLQPWPLKLVLDNVLRAKPAGGWLNQWILATAGTDKHALLLFAAIAGLLLAILGAFCSWSEKYTTTTVGQWVMHDLRGRVYARIQRLSLSWHDQSKTGDLISRVTSDIDSIQSFVTSGLLSALLNILTLAGMVGVMFYLNWRFTLVALSIAPFLFLVVFRYTRLIKQFSREVRKKESQMVSVIQEMLTSIRVVRAFAREDYEQRRLEEQSLESVEAALKARGLKARLSPLVEIIVAAGTSLVLWYGGRMVLNGELSPGSLVVFILYLSRMYKPMQELSKMTDAWSKASVGYERIREVLDTDSDLKDLPSAIRAPRFRGLIEFSHVTFGYDPAQPVLRDFSLRIEPGQVAALVGPTGAGKTSVISLIPRFYDPQSGSVRVDGRDVRAWKQKSLREQISFVLQDNVLFNAPVWQNIAYGKPNATRTAIEHAAELANAREFIEKMPEGYNTMIGERGVTLSGGQRQRIAIARAIIRDTPILILDEISSGLDAASESLVFEALDRLMEGKTCIVIAHRLSTVRKAGIICVVKDGAVAESGTHEELMSKGGLYAELHDIQFQTA